VIESVPKVAVPVRFREHDDSPGAVALAAADHLILVGELRPPSALPVNLRSPGQLALNVPFIEDGVCSVTFHLKSVHVLGVGMRVDEVQLPRSELFPAIDGSVSELLCSSSVQPAATVATSDNMTR
jgi:hypothetical protein